MSLYRVGKIWYVDLASNEGRLRKSTRTSDKASAQEFHDKRQDGLWRQSALGERPPIHWGEAVATWLGLGDRGKQDKYRLKALEPFKQETLPFSSEVMAKCLSSLRGSTYNRTLGLICAVHRASGVEPVKIERKATPNGRTRWLTAEEWKRLRKALPDLHRQMAEFTLATGLRENNVLRLEWPQVDLRRRVAWIHPDQAKGGQAIAVPLNTAAVAVLRERGAKRKGWVFGSPEPYWQASNKAWYEALKRAKLVGFRWHDLRHTWASWAVMAGVSLAELKELGGWKTAALVNRYAHLSASHLARASAKIRPPVA